MIQLFAPGSKTVNIAVSAASANVKVADAGARQLCIVNDGTATVWIAWGTDNTVVASAASGLPIRAGDTRGITIPLPPAGPVWVAAIAAGSTGNIYFTPGAGI